MSANPLIIPFENMRRSEIWGRHLKRANLDTNDGKQSCAAPALPDRHTRVGIRSVCKKFPNFMESVVNILTFVWSCHL